MEGLTILRYPRGLRNKGLITQKTVFQHGFAQFSRYRVLGESRGSPGGVPGESRGGGGEGGRGESRGD